MSTDRHVCGKKDGGERRLMTFRSTCARFGCPAHVCLRLPVAGKAHRELGRSGGAGGLRGGCAGKGTVDREKTEEAKNRTRTDGRLSFLRNKKWLNSGVTKRSACSFSLPDVRRKTTLLLDEWGRMRRRAGDQRKTNLLSRLAGGVHNAQ